ncbi:hypothetical protein Tco_1142636 [Tanacetum coccineum]
MAFLTAAASSRFPFTNNQLRTSSNPRNQANIQDGQVTVQQVHVRQGQNYSGTTYKGNATLQGEIQQTEDLDTYDSDCDDLSTAQAVLMANISNYGSDIISEVPNSETYLIWIIKGEFGNDKLKNLKYHLTQFDSVGEERTTPNALEDGEWGF